MKNIYLKITFLVSFGILGILAAKAQFNLGLETGLSGSTQANIGNLYVNDGVSTNFSIGFSTYYKLNNWMSIKSGINYEGKGRKLEIGETTSNIITQNLNYISLPLKTEYYSGEAAGFKNGQKLFFATGPYIAYLISANQIDHEQDSDIMNDLKKTDFGWSFEIGMKFPTIKEKAILFSINYDMGLIKISKSDSNLRNKTVSLNLGILL